MNVSFNQIILALNQLTLQEKRGEHYGLSIAKEISLCIREDREHPLKEKVLNEVCRQNEEIEKKIRESKNQLSETELIKAEKKLQQIKFYYSGQKTLQLAAGISSRTLCRIISGKQKLTVKVWKKISPVLDVTLDSLEQKKLESVSKKAIKVTSHGLIRSYRKGCRCSACKAVWQRYLDDLQ